MTNERTRLTTELENAHRAERDLIDKEATAKADLQRLERELAELANTQPDQFDGSGKPKAKSEAAKVAATVEALRTPAAPWAARRQVAEERTRQARNKLANFENENFEEIVAEFEPEARQVVEDIRALLTDLLDATNRHSKISQECTRLTIPVRGLDGQDMPMAGAVSEIRQAALRALDQDIPLPLPRSLYPEGSLPPKVKTRGGWVPYGTEVPEENVIERAAA